MYIVVTYDPKGRRTHSTTCAIEREEVQFEKIVHDLRNMGYEILSRDQLDDRCTISCYGHRVAVIERVVVVE